MIALSANSWRRSSATVFVLLVRRFRFAAGVPPSFVSRPPSLCSPPPLGSLLSSRTISGACMALLVSTTRSVSATIWLGFSAALVTAAGAVIPFVAATLWLVSAIFLRFAAGFFGLSALFIPDSAPSLGAAILLVFDGVVPLLPAASPVTAAPRSKAATRTAARCILAFVGLQILFFCNVTGGGQTNAAVPRTPACSLHPTSRAVKIAI
mmetsp:Transcript_59253/g.86909  ORF Transcript_59253/g.86909 Transcript_59253/m.86909 type:complete len:209 (+) Transcript_59253:1151-1777(+)